MGQYKHVLAAVDITDEAPEVLARAHEAAADSGANLSVVAVIRPLTYAYTGLEVAGLTAAAMNFEQEAEASVAASLEKLCAGIGVDPSQRHIMFGIPANEIKNTAKSIGADLIVVGSHGRHGLGLLLGSTATGVLHGAQCDILTVRVSGD